MTESDGRLTPRWRRWLAQNLLKDAETDDIVEMLEANGVPPSATRAVMAEVRARPEFQAARAELRRLRQQRVFFQLQRALAKTAPNPTAVIRRGEIPGETFFETFYATNTPVIVEGFADAWPARTRWTPDYFRTRYGDVDVAVTTDRLSDPDYDMNTTDHTETMPMGAYVDRVLATAPTNDLYMVANNRNLENPALASLMDDVVYRDDYFKPEGWRGCTALWIGPAGTVTPFHHDTCNILFVQLYGTKRFTLVPPTETRLLDGARSMYAAIDPESPAMEAHCPDAVVKTVDVGPGEALFIPIGWWHHVRALDVSVSLACTHFVRPNFFNWYRPGDVK